MTVPYMFAFVAGSSTSDRLCALQSTLICVIVKSLSTVRDSTVIMMRHFLRTIKAFTPPTGVVNLALTGICVLTNNLFDLLIINGED